MRDSTAIVRDRQTAIRREMDRRGISMKAVSLDAEMSPSTVASYFSLEKDKEPASMSVAALYRFLETGAIPLDLLSLLLPAGHVIVHVPEDIDIDDFCEVASDLVNDRIKASHPSSECGPAVGPNERAQMMGKIATLRAA